MIVKTTSRILTPKLLISSFSAILLFSTNPASAHLGPVPMSMKGIPVPPTPGLMNGASPIIVDKAKAVALGKALFWDMNIGSDGMACASCHFHAGADGRMRNQRSPAGASQTADEQGSRGTPTRLNVKLKQSDFPLVQTKAPLTEGSAILHETNTVVGSSGIFRGQFSSVQVESTSSDMCDRTPDAVFHVGAIGTRMVTRRNAPTVINAVFNHRLFWDGRANNLFNGVNNWGPRDPDAGVWVQHADGKTTKERLLLENSALASQALGPPVSVDEMACTGRRYADLGRKLLTRRPLEKQIVAWNDSVLGPLASSTSSAPAKGLKTSYLNLIREAFDRRYWGDDHQDANKYGTPLPNRANPSPPAFNQIEANFSFFFGLSIQMYESTLISDDAPFDRSRRDALGNPVDLPESAQRGMQVFREAHCNVCHVGPHFTAAAITSNSQFVHDHPEAFNSNSISVATSENVLTRLLASGITGFVDTGFAATGVGRDEWDLGLAGNDTFGNPLSFSMQYLDYLAGHPEKVLDPSVEHVRACDLQIPIAAAKESKLARTFTNVQGIRPQPQGSESCIFPTNAFLPTVEAARAELASPDNQRMHVAIQSAFKVPSLRNVELTGPYMHNGSMATLEQVIEFYTRGGNFMGAAKQGALVFGQPQLEFKPTQRADLIAFLKSLTDERVRYSRAPFDHPELFVPDGHPGDPLNVEAGNQLDPRLARDHFFHLLPVGRDGSRNPLNSFEQRLNGSN
jgi:cytochrome c peroxidase